MKNSNKRLHDAEKEISSLKIDIHSLKTENQRLKEHAVKFQEKFKFIGQNFSEFEQNFTSASFGRVQYETTVSEKIKEFESNTSMVLYSIKTEVGNLSVKLQDLNKHTTELNMSVSKMIESKLTEYSVSVNKSVSEINHKLLSSKDFHTQMVYNLSAVENDLTSIRNMISGIFNFFSSQSRLNPIIGRNETAVFSYMYKIIGEHLFLDHQLIWQIFYHMNAMMSNMRLKNKTFKSS